MFIFRPAFCRGDHTLTVSSELFKCNRKRLCERLQANKNVPKGAIVLLQGGESETRHCSDHEPLFRQVSLIMNQCTVQTGESDYERVQTHQPENEEKSLR